MSTMLEGRREIERALADEYVADLDRLSRLPADLDDLRAVVAGSAVRLMTADARLDDVARAAQGPRSSSTAGY